jgi:hypothetical protein
MKKLNTLPIEDFLDKARIAIKSNQKNLTLTLKEVTDLHYSLSVVMTRLAGETALVPRETPSEEKVQIKMDGGKF